MPFFVSRIKSAVRGFLSPSCDLPSYRVGLNNENNRNNWVKLQLGSLPAGVKLLDAGAGEGPYRRFCSHLDYVSQDFGAYEGTGDGAGLQTGRWDVSAVDIVCDITQVPRPDGSFDAILCTEVLEHLPRPIDAIREFGRLLRPGGILLLTAPFCSLTHFAPYHFYSGFNRYFYSTILPKEGFDITEMHTNGSWPDYIAQELRYRLTNQYSSVELSSAETEAVTRIIAVLQRMADTDKGSEELLTFGYHVRAVRR